MADEQKTTQTPADAEPLSPEEQDARDRVSESRSAENSIMRHFGIAPR